MRKYGIIVASTFIDSDISQLQIVLGIVIVALHMHDSHRPYGVGIEDNHRMLHRFEMTSLLLLAFVVWCGLYFTTSSQLCSTTQQGFCIGLSVLVLVLNGGYMLLLLGKCCKEWKKRSFRRKANPLDIFIQESVLSELPGKKKTILNLNEIELGVMKKNPMAHNREAKKS